MKRVLGLVIVCLLLSSCNGSVSYEEALAQNRREFKDAKKLDDAGFVVELKSWNMLTIKILTIAADSAYSSVVVSFSKTTLPAHKKLDEEILDFAKKKDITLPDELSPEHQILLSQLTSSRRKDFDKTFSRIVTHINDENNSLFTSNATQASDPDVRAFAARNLGLFRAHAQLVSAMQSQLLNTSD
jgi:putative membrane protein